MYTQASLLTPTPGYAHNPRAPFQTARSEANRPVSYGFIGHMATLAAWLAVAVTVVVSGVGWRLAAPRVRIHAWMEEQEGDPCKTVWVQMENVGAASTTVDLGEELYSAWAWDDKPRNDHEVRANVTFEGPSLPYRLPGHSGPVRWHASCNPELLVPHGLLSGSALMARLGNRRKPRSVAIEAKPPAEWKVAKAW
jgi:hypothetical protein